MTPFPLPLPRRWGANASWPPRRSCLPTPALFPDMAHSLLQCKLVGNVFFCQFYLRANAVQADPDFAAQVATAVALHGHPGGFPGFDRIRSGRAPLLGRLASWAALASRCAV